MNDFTPTSRSEGGGVVMPLRTERPRPDLDLVTVVPSPGVGTVGPFVSIARFSLSGRVFPPHPHAGFTAMTYVLPHSAGAMLNRDSLGGIDVIRPGGAHWTVANAGMQHEETPEIDGVAVEGFQIFINHPAAAKAAAPTRHHAEPHDIPHWHEQDGATLRLILGDYEQHQAPTVLPVDATMVEVRLKAEASMVWHTAPKHRVAAFLEAGTLRSGGQNFSAPAIVSFGAGTTEATFAAGDAGAYLFLFGGPDLTDPVVAQGPFIMSSQTEIDAARARFRDGRMGVLPPRGR